MTPTEAAAYLSIHPAQIRQYEVEQGLPVHRLGTGPKAQRRFYRTELDAWLRSRCTDNPPGQGAAS